LTRGLLHAIDGLLDRYAVVTFAVGVNGKAIGSEVDCLWILKR
jgi:hypothetical protein